MAIKSTKERWSFFLLFFAYLFLCFALLSQPERGALFFFLLETLLVAVAWTLGADVAALLILVASLVLLGLWFQWPADQKLFLVLSVPQMWLIYSFLHAFDKKNFQWRLDHAAAKSDLEKSNRDLTQDINFFNNWLEHNKVKSARREQMSQCARNLGAVLKADQVQARLVESAQQTFPDEKIQLTGLLDTDPADARVLQRGQPVLCEDLFDDPRFRGTHVEISTRSFLVAPVWVENKIVGALRVESPVPKRFGKDDLRLLEALTTMGSLALDNALLYQRIEQLAVRDGLTNLLTHKAFEERLEEEILRAGRYHYPVSLAMVDVDHFKKVNDSYGHAAGDDVLRRLSTLLAGAVRPVDLAARYGGEEFCLLLVDVDNASAVAVAEQLRLALSAEEFSSAGKRFRVTMSVGVATYPAEAATPQQLVRTADQRLYAAKTGGRNRTVGGAA